jgi:hypothetical protein
MGKKMNIIRQTAVWLGRINHCRGFGVQSPSAYLFVRYVVNEHYPYYAYSELERECPCEDRRRRKLYRLYLRLANYRQAAAWIHFGSHDAAVRRYVGAGCKATAFFSLHDSADLDSRQPLGIISIERVDGAAGILKRAINMADSKTVIVIEQIKSSPSARRMWDEAQRDSRVICAFDLYYCGILFFNPIMQKQSFKINF